MVEVVAVLMPPEARRLCCVLKFGGWVLEE